MPELNEQILNRLGIADAMAHRAKATAKRLHQAAAKHHDALNGELAGLAQQIEGAGIGNNPELEERYCRALVARSHMAQAHTMAHADSLRMPEVGGNLKKGQESFNFDEAKHPREQKGAQREGYKPGEFVPVENLFDQEDLSDLRRGLEVGKEGDEHIVWRSADGHSIVLRGTGKNEFGVPGAELPADHRQEVERWKELTINHNHPESTSFSIPDLRTFAALKNFRHANLVLPDGEIHQITRPAGVDVSPERIEEAQAKRPDWFMQAEDAHPDASRQQLRSEVMRRFVEHLGWQFTVSSLPPLTKGRVSRAQAEAAGQAAFGFEEQDHPRAAEGTAGQYKPGEFVPKAEQQGAAEKPAHEKEPWETPLSDMKPISHYNKQEWDQYADENGKIVDSSRTTPQQLADIPLGTWRYSDWKGPRGREVEQLREVDPKDLIPGEETEQSKHADVDRYAGWAKEGKIPPPIEVVETDDGKLKVVNGHRRWLAAKRTGTPRLRAWVSPSSVIPDMKDSEGRPMKTGLTHELAIHHAIEAGHRVPDEVLQDYPDLKAKHDQKRKETLREAAGKAEEAGFPGLAEAHQDLDPKEDWEKNGVRAKSFKSWFGDWESDPKNASKIVTDDGEPEETHPVKLYHGTKSDFRSFDPEQAARSTGHPTAQFGFFFSESETIARTFAGEMLREVPEKDLNDLAREQHGVPYYALTDQDVRRDLVKQEAAQPKKVISDKKKPADSRVLTCYLNIRNPYRMDLKEWNEKFIVPSWLSKQSRAETFDRVKEFKQQLLDAGHDGMILGKSDDPKSSVNEYAACSYVAFHPEQIKSVHNEGTFDPTNPNMNKAVRRPFVPPDMPRWRGAKPSRDSYLPLNGVEDREKFGQMIQAMKAGDWSWNVPLVRCGDQLLTGSHRYAAAKVVGIPLEVVDVDDLFKEAGGLDFKTTWEAGADPWTAWLNNMDAALKCLPPDLLAKYGVDLG